MNSNDRLALAEWTIKQALKSGADDAAVAVSANRGVEVEYRDNKIDKLQESTQNSLNLQIYAQKRYSSHSTSDLKKDTLENFIKEAVKATKYLTEDEFRKLPDPKYYPGSAALIDLQLKDELFEKVETSDRIRIASEIESAAKKVSGKIISAASGYSDSTYNVTRMHSNGFSGQFAGTMFSAGAEVTVKDDDGGRPEDWYYGSVRYFNDLPDPEFLGVSAAERALKKIGQKKIKSGVYNMLVENRAASRLISVLSGAMTARSIQQKASFLDGMLGKGIASEKLTITDDPFIIKGMNSRTYDGEGIAAKKRIMINKGVLKNYFIDNYYGRKIGMEPTTGSPSNLVYEAGSHSFEDIIKIMKDGLIVNGFIGGNSNSTTGDFSFGIVGMLVENGEIIKPINEMNISGNAKDFFSRLIEVGNDPYKYSSNKVPSLFFTGINFSGT